MIPAWFDFREHRELCARIRHEVWLGRVKAQRLPLLSVPPCEATPIFPEVQNVDNPASPFVSTVLDPSGGAR